MLHRFLFLKIYIVHDTEIRWNNYILWPMGLTNCVIYYTIYNIQWLRLFENVVQCDFFFIYKSRI